MINAIHVRRTARYRDVATALPAASGSTHTETLRALDTARLVIRNTNPRAGRDTYAVNVSGEKLLNRLRMLLDDIQA